DSDANASGVTGQYVLAAGDNNLTVDAGLVEYTTKDVAFNFNGSSSGSGTYGNIRSYTENGVTVNASAFSRNDSTGDWDTAYLGTFSGGLGVTNRGESGSGRSHTVDNNGADDYVLFEFSDTVTIDSATLGYVVNDSDMSVWIGTVDGAFDSHLTLSDSVLSNMGFTEVSNGSSSARVADLNSGEYEGNVMIIAAKTTSSNDYFKIQHLNVQVKESVCDSGECAPIIIEAEDMQRVDYIIESNSAASGGEVVKLSDHDGYVKTTFNGDSGNYDFTLNYIDENDGSGVIKIKINGTTVKTINLDQQVGDHTNGFASITIEDLQLNTGDTIKIVGWCEGSEYARIDSIVLKNCDTTTNPMNEAPVDGDECVTVSENDGRQTLTNALANALDADGDALVVKSLEGEDLTNGGDDWDVATGSNGGLLYIYTDGRVEFDTNSEFDALNTGETATTSFTYVVSDGNGGENESTYKVVVNGEGAQKASLGDRVWHDRDQDGYQDSSESGINSVRLDLYKWTGSATVWAAKTYTDSNGDYSFDNLDEGYYYVRADKSTLPYGYEFTAKDRVTDSADSDVNSGGYTAWIWLDAGEQDNNWDVGAYYCPIVIDLDGDGVQTLSVDAGTRFDMDNDGSADSTGWISGSDAFIVHDANSNGVIDNRSEMFGGDNTGDGFRKLAAFDTNGDGVINLSDDAFAQLQVWQDANENGITDAGELSSLADAGLAALDVQFETRTEGADTEQNGNRLLDWSTAEQTDGSTVDLVDVYFAKGDGIDLSNLESLESSSASNQTNLSMLDLGMDQQEFAYDGAVSNAFDVLDIPDMAILGTADEQQIV
ncbi:SdrD B-like domain-containing protein, partial [Neptunomonas sp.]|uniref:SdrD B-like domain-containing protein n=1 Tax=Neptunomonas sp. TaxID=1971898 RepID=UPI0025D85F64